MKKIDASKPKAKKALPAKAVKKAVVAAPAVKAVKKGQGKGAPGKGRRGNPDSLKAMVLKVTAKKPLNRHELLVAVQKAGYKFVAKDPLNSLSTLLYTAKEIKNFGGKFGPK